MCGFSWLRKSESTLAQGTDELVTLPDLPPLALQHESKVEQMVFLKLSQGYIPEGQKYNAVIAAQQERRSQMAASRICNRNNRRLLGRSSVSKYRRVRTKRQIHAYKVEGMRDVIV